MYIYIYIYVYEEVLYERIYITTNPCLMSMFVLSPKDRHGRVKLLVSR